MNILYEPFLGKKSYILFCDSCKEGVISDQPTLSLPKNIYCGPTPLPTSQTLYPHYVFTLQCILCKDSIKTELNLCFSTLTYLSFSS
jgi:hypothetical protein